VLPPSINISSYIKTRTFICIEGFREFVPLSPQDKKNPCFSFDLEIWFAFQASVLDVLTPGYMSICLDLLTQI
jgi:hypothetical protein